MDAWDADVLDAQFNSHRVPFRPPAIADIPENQQLRQQADVVIEGFRRLIAQCEFHSPSTPVDLDIDRLRSKRGLLTDLRTDTAPKLALVLELQSQIGQTLDQTIRTMDDFIPGRVPEPNQTNDKHFKEFKAFRIHGLDFAIRDRAKNTLFTFLRALEKLLKN
ncbi:hypothetical protein Pst134EB_022093 [Puccinia striiformis f. sp. tritici]|nr:hypothetical protein Pst134EB_022093 [Puccinia striiformis f. sp. tritici]